MAFRPNPISISEGEFPQGWKEALVTPVLKKGDTKMKENYKPVSCLPAASKQESGPNVRSMRSITNEVLSMQSFSELSKNTFINDGIKAWNKAPAKIKDCITYASAKN